AKVARLATIGAGGKPHVVPITFAVDGDTIYFAVDAKPKRTTDLKRLRNIAANSSVSVLVDHYEDDWTKLWWVRVDGTARLLADSAGVRPGGRAVSGDRLPPLQVPRGAARRSRRRARAGHPGTDPGRRRRAGRRAGPYRALDGRPRGSRGGLAGHAVSGLFRQVRAADRLDRDLFAARAGQPRHPRPPARAAGGAHARARAHGLSRRLRGRREPGRPDPHPVFRGQRSEARDGGGGD